MKHLKTIFKLINALPTATYEEEAELDRLLNKKSQPLKKIIKQGQKTTSFSTDIDGSKLNAEVERMVQSDMLWLRSEMNNL